MLIKTEGPFEIYSYNELYYIKVWIPNSLNTRWSMKWVSFPPIHHTTNLNEAQAYFSLQKALEYIDSLK